MSKQTLLSAEISRGRALLAGGASAHETLSMLRQWVLRVPARGPKRPSPSILRWNESVCAVVREVMPLGAPVGRLLREVQPMVRREERHFAKQQGVERQFAFQAAIAVVIPWAVASLSGGIHLNPLTLAGAAFQGVGLFLFGVIVKRASRISDHEQNWLFDFLVGAWMRVLAGMSLHTALEAALEMAPTDNYKKMWRGWFVAYSGGAWQLDSFFWPESMPQSRPAAALMLALLRSGAPASETLADYISQIDDDRQAALEERIGGLPVRLSLGFCAFFAPAVFLILLGALWPSIQDLPL